MAFAVSYVHLLCVCSYGESITRIKCFILYKLLFHVTPSSHVLSLITRFICSQPAQAAQTAGRLCSRAPALRFRRRRKPDLVSCADESMLNFVLFFRARRLRFAAIPQHPGGNSRSILRGLMRGFIAVTAVWISGVVALHE